MAAYRGLISVADVQAIMPSATTSVARMRIKQVSDRFEQACGRRFGLRTYPEDAGEILETTERGWLTVSSWPIRDVSRILFDDAEQDLDDIDNQHQKYNDDGVLTIDAPRGTVIRAEYTGGYILPGDTVMAYNRSAGVLQVRGGSSDAGTVTIRGLTEDGVVTEEVTLDADNWVSTDAEWLPGGVWEGESYSHTGTVQFRLAGQTLGSLASSQYICAATDIPGDLQAALLDLIVSRIARPVSGIQREEIPGGAKIQWSTQTGDKSDVELAFNSAAARYRRFSTA